MKIIIAGSRSITDYEYVKKCIEDCGMFYITEVVSGTAKGVDRMGEQWAKENNIAIKQFPADWDKLGKKAGYIRNGQMADYADGLIAIWDGSSKGTNHMINIAKERGLEIFISKKVYEKTNNN